MVIKETCIILVIYWYFQIQQYVSIFEHMNGGDDTTTIKVSKEMVLRAFKVLP
jgi:hypothetical protein